MKLATETLAARFRLLARNAFRAVAVAAGAEDLGRLARALTAAPRARYAHDDGFGVTDPTRRRLG
jgi:hypothetical protein